MKLLVAVVLIAFVTFVFAVEEANWEKYKEKYNKKYDDPAEDARRKELYLANVKEVNEHNEKFERGEVSYTKGVNQFSDQTKEEFSHLLGARPPQD